jgi:hypothetical protein
MRISAIGYLQIRITYEGGEAGERRPYEERALAVRAG